LHYWAMRGRGLVWLADPVSDQDVREQTFQRGKVWSRQLGVDY